MAKKMVAWHYNSHKKNQYGYSTLRIVWGSNSLMILWDLHNNVWLDIYSEVVRTALKEKLSADTSSTCYFTAGATLRRLII